MKPALTGEDAEAFLSILREALPGIRYLADSAVTTGAIDIFCQNAWHSWASHVEEEIKIRCTQQSNPPPNNAPIMKDSHTFVETKTDTAFAAYDPGSLFLPFTTRRTRREVETYLVHEYWSTETTWAQLRAQGYRIVRVNVTPAKQPETTP